ncbi:MAG: GFA family protein [Thermodesulfobacteriota bacterium]
MPNMLKGSCLCGNIHYQYTGDLGPVVMCHCSQCRKSSGTAFATNSPVDKSQFKIISGNEFICEYESSPGKFRAFCSNCGTPIYSRRESIPDQLRIRLGTVDTEVDERPSFHIFVSSKAGWYSILDELPQFPEFEQGR